MIAYLLTAQAKAFRSLRSFKFHLKCNNQRIKTHEKGHFRRFSSNLITKLFTGKEFKKFNRIQDKSLVVGSLKVNDQTRLWETFDEICHQQIMSNIYSYESRNSVSANKIYKLAISLPKQCTDNNDKSQIFKIQLTLLYTSIFIPLYRNIKFCTEPRLVQKYIQ